MKGVVMGRVIPFPSKLERDAEAKKMIQIANELDSVILRHLDVGDVDPRDMAGLIAHRLGTLMRHIDEKSKLWDVCEKVLKAQAALD
jgi:hypothetical protein